MTGKKAASGLAVEQAESRPADMSEIETAAYISDVSLQLRNLAKKQKLNFLVYLLEMVFQEAWAMSQKIAKP